MRLVLQRVSRASVEVNGVIENRIGLGLVLTLALSKGDNVEAAKKLATTVLKLNLWPELMDPDTSCCTNVVDNGYEVLVLLQQSLHATFQKLTPDESRSLASAEAQEIFDAFMSKLKEEYQEEMVASAPADSPSMQLEMACVGGGIYMLGAGDTRPVAAAVPTKRPLSQATTPAGGGAQKEEQLTTDLAVMTRALQRIHLFAKNKAMLETLRIFRMMSKDAFREALADAEQEETNMFAEALESSARFFTEAQQEKITELTGLTISAQPLNEEGARADDQNDDEGGDDPDDVARQLAELQEEVVDPSKGIQAAKRRRAGMAVKEEDDTMAVRQRPDWNSKAAPETPAALAARQWAARRAGAHVPPPAPWAGGKGGGGKNQHGFKGGKGGFKGAPRPHRSLGIVSVEGSAMLHGGAGNRRNHTAVNMLPKGTPTVAPMCPASQGGEEDL